MYNMYYVLCVGGVGAFLGLGFLGFLAGLCRAIRIFVPLWRKGNESFYF